MNESEVAIQNNQTKECPFCSEDVKINAKKCKHCGETIDVALRAAEEAKSSNTNSPNVFMNAGGGGGGAASNQTAPTASGSIDINLKSKSKTTAGIIALLLGGLGIHKFYLGKPFQGILYLLLCWTYVPSLIALVEGIAYLTMSETKFHQKYG